MEGRLSEDYGKKLHCGGGVGGRGRGRDRGEEMQSL
jgi:hypothetical protein